MTPIFLETFRIITAASKKNKTTETEICKSSNEEAPKQMGKKDEPKPKTP
jgi:hypothetical protein